MKHRNVPVIAFLAAALLASALSAARAEPLRVAIGLSLPPYVISDEESGMEYDIVKEALAAAGYELVPVFVDFGLVPTTVANGLADAAMTVTPATVPNLPLSDIYIQYRNAALTLRSSRIAIGSIGDLAGRSISAFQKATDYLPPAFAEAVAGNPDYHETPQQYRQPLALFTGQVEVVIADVNIFNWYRQDVRVRAAADTDQHVVTHAIFEPTPYHMAFRDAAVRDAFDAALAAMRASGRYSEILAAYGATE